MTDDYLLHSTRRLIGAALLALATAVSWWAWTAWDLRRDVDPVTGSSTGPWEVWQVAGVVLTLLAVVIAAVRWLQAWLVVVVVPLTFTGAWSLTAASQDDSGLWGVGAVLVLLGTLAGTAVVATVTVVLRARTAPREA